MQVQHVWLILSPEYDEICLPSTIAERGEIGDQRKSAKAIRRHLTKHDMGSYQRKAGESVNHWTARLENEFGEFAECVSPPKKVQASNNRYYEGQTALLLMATLEVETLRDALSLALMIDCLDPQKEYSVTAILDAWPLPLSDRSRILRLLSDCEKVLMEFHSNEIGTSGLILGGLFQRLIPAGTMQKAKSWFYERELVPCFFGDPPSWMYGENPTLQRSKKNPWKRMVVQVFCAAVVIFGFFLFRAEKARSNHPNTPESRQYSVAFQSYPMQQSREKKLIPRKQKMKYFLSSIQPPGT